MADQDPSPKTQADPIELIAEGQLSVEAICIESNMSILELAEHVCTPRNLEALGRVARLHAIQQEMLLGRLKRDALVRLAELTDEVPSGSADEVRAFEVMRKACVDILRFGNGAARREGGEEPGSPGGGYHPDPITPAFEAEVLEALERLGEETNQDEPRASGEPHGPPACPPGRGQMSGKVNGVPWSKAKPQATSGGDVVEEVEVTQEVQVGMAFGKTSDHGTESIRTRTGGTPMPPSEILTNHTCPPACPPGPGADDGAALCKE